MSFDYIRRGQEIQVEDLYAYAEEIRQQLAAGNCISRSYLVEVYKYVDEVGSNSLEDLGTHCNRYLHHGHSQASIEAVIATVDYVAWFIDECCINGD